MRLGAIVFTFGLMIAGFQNCTKLEPNSDSKASNKQYGNGDGYSGKGELYRRYDPLMPCAELDRDGKPLPNTQIFYQKQTLDGAKQPYVVRENCVDITPRQIASSDIQFDAAGNLMFGGQSFNNFMATADFQVLASSCPVGKSPIPGVTRTNLIVKSQDWTEQPIYQGWMWHAGILALLNGSIKSLPAYQIVRHDPAYPEEFRRLSQIKFLKASTDYVFSFLAKKGTRDIVTFRYYRLDGRTGNEEYIIVDFNLLAGTFRIRLNDYLAPARVAMTPVGEGFFATVYFTTSARTADGFSDFGFSPMAVDGVTQVGDSIYATAAQLEEVNGFCQ